ncbi:hypothetical protein BJ741DRAFT_626996 [Chytriomyces cf. hyalinus JEL632]|nr:hypothetical protein BJ741DRAFT_626996 [Chytriomyces cf. hyalinus JEL632]
MTAINAPAETRLEHSAAMGDPPAPPFHSTNQQTAYPAHARPTPTYSQHPPAPVIASSKQLGSTSATANPCVVVPLSLAQLKLFSSNFQPNQIQNNLNQRNLNLPSVAPSAQPYPAYAAPRASAIPDNCLTVLEDNFRKSSKPTRSEKRALSERLAIPYTDVQLWFQNKRAHLRRDTLSTSLSPQKKDIKVWIPPSAVHMLESPSDTVSPVDAADMSHRRNSTPSICQSSPQMESDSRSDRGVKAESAEPAKMGEHNLDPFESLNAKSARPRIKPHHEQTDFLISKFAINPRPGRDERTAISKQVNLPFNFVTLWFQNRRSKVARVGAGESHARATIYSLRSDKTLGQVTTTSTSMEQQNLMDAASLLFSVARGGARN